MRVGDITPGRGVSQPESVKTSPAKHSASLSEAEAGIFYKFNRSDLDRNFLLVGTPVIFTAVL